MSESDSNQSKPPAASTSTPPPSATVPPAHEATATPSVSGEPVFNQARTHVWMRNDETDGVWEAPIGYVDTALADGWVFTDDPNAAPDPSDFLAAMLAEHAADTAPETDTQTGYDPAGHSPDQVNAYLAELAPTAPGEVARILQAEHDGKNRSTVKAPATGA